MAILGYFAAVLIGLSLGLIGGGGSILTVPVLVYLFKIDPTQATSYSLFIVGSTSLVGAIRNYRLGLVNVQTALLFGATSITTVWLTRKFLVPLIPVSIPIGHYTVARSFLTMALFAVLMLLASYSMIRNKKTGEEVPESTSQSQAIRRFLYGIGIGLVTGLLGAGGGFLIIPVLVLLLHLPMKQAVGTSLFIIALNSLIGFTGDIGHFQVNWVFMFTITAIAVAGILIGSQLGKKIPGAKLKKGFGWFVLVMGIYILTKELFFK
jgi:uncharacterized membrane protein YfcA